MRLTNEDIIDDTHPLIREKSEDVKLPLNKEDEELLQAMYEYVNDSTDPEKAEAYNLSPAVGIAAIQVGRKKNMIAVVVHDDEDNKGGSYALANPKIISESVQKAYLDGGEGCLSVPEKHEGHIYRAARITVTAYDLLTKQDVKIRAKGYLAIVLQHEIDHLSGILYYDHLDLPISQEDIENAKVI